MPARRGPQRHRTRGGVLGSPSRGELIGDALRVLAALDHPRTVSEIAEASVLHPRKVYRILEALPAAGLTIEVHEQAHGGPGSPHRRYRVSPWPPFPDAPRPRRP